MKRLLPLVVMLGLMGSSLLYFGGCGAKHEETSFALDSIDIYLPLEPLATVDSVNFIFGEDSIPGHKFEHRALTDSSEVYIDYNLMLLDQNPNITADILDFMHSELKTWGFIETSDSIKSFDAINAVKEGENLESIINTIIENETSDFYKNLVDIFEWNPIGFSMEFTIYPVYIDHDYVTYLKQASSYTGGAHGNEVSYLQTYNLKTGDKVELEDIIEKDKIYKFREKVVAHMAAKYPIYQVTNVQEYLDSLNSFLGNYEADDKQEESTYENFEKITVENYPLTHIAVHEAGLVCSYNKYELTPGSDGNPYVVISYKEIADWLKEPFKDHR